MDKPAAGCCSSVGCGLACPCFGGWAAGAVDLRVEGRRIRAHGSTRSSCWRRDCVHWIAHCFRFVRRVSLSIVSLVFDVQCGI